MGIEIQKTISSPPQYILIMDEDDFLNLVSDIAPYTICELPEMRRWQEKANEIGIIGLNKLDTHRTKAFKNILAPPKKPKTKPSGILRGKKK